MTPGVSRISSVSGALDPDAPAFESPLGKKSAGPTMVSGGPEGQSGDKEGTLIEPEEGGFEKFGGGKRWSPICGDPG